MATNKHRKKKNMKKNVTQKRYKRHYRKRQFKNGLREYLVSDDQDIKNVNSENIANRIESGNMVHGLRHMLSTTNNKNK